MFWTKLFRRLGFHDFFIKVTFTGILEEAESQEAPAVVMTTEDDVVLIT